MADILWTDPRDKKVWRVYNFKTSPALSTSNPPLLSEGRIGFRHPPEPGQTVESYWVRNPDLSMVNDLHDAVLCSLLDSARDVAF